MIGRVRRRPDRQPATVVVDDRTAYVIGVEVDVVQLLALASNLPHSWDGIAGRWTFAAVDALALAAALRAANRHVRLASGTAS